MSSYVTLRALLLATTVVLSAPAFAQEAIETPVPAPPAEVEQESPVNAGVSIATGYNDNVYATRNREEGDFYALVRPFVRVDLGSAGTTLKLRGDGEVNRYDKLTAENYEDWSLAADGRARLGADLSLIGGAEWRWDHESRASPEAVSGLEPTQYQRGFGYLGLVGSTKRFTARVAGTLTRYDFDDVATTGGSINNDDRDRRQGELGARAGTILASGSTLFVQGAYDWRDYDDRIDDRGFNRSSDGFSLAAGLRGKLGPAFSGEIYAGWLRQDYRDARLKNVDTFDVGAVLDWNGKDGLGGSFRLDRAVEETTLAGASAYVLTSARIGLRNDVHPRLSAGIGLTGSHYDYVSDPRTEFAIGGDAWAKYWISRHLYLGADYVHAERSSNAAGFDYEQNRFLVSVGAQLRPAFSADATPLRLGAEAPGGAYLALLAAHGTLVAGLDGPRGENGSNTADFGDHGAAGVAVAGFGLLTGDLYLGLEAEGSLLGPDWLHTSDRVFSMDKRNAFGIAARVGWATPRRDLVYARFGWSSAAMRIDYVHSGNTYAATDRLTGVGGGGGIEVPVGVRGFLRGEYVVTSYADVDVPAGGGKFDNMSASEGQFRFGGGFRFGAAAASENGRVAAGRIRRRLRRPPGRTRGSRHQQPGSPRRGQRDRRDARQQRWPGRTLRGLRNSPRQSLSRRRSRSRCQRDRLETSSATPTGAFIRRSTITRSADRRARACGWGGTALLYARAGAVRTRFEVPYATSGAAVRSTMTRDGLRFGGGLEIGLGGRARLRADYTLSEYDRYDVAYGSKADAFDHSEALFRLGVSWRL